jgi:O-antigen ligase/tetratricopeptide (TPR) repeat protein
MAKNYKNKEKTPTPAAAAAGGREQSSFKANFYNLFPLVACALYFMVHFISDWGAYDAMGAQWMYMVCLDLVVIIVLLARKNDYTVAISRQFNNNFSKLYLAFFVLAGVSIFTAINPTEGWVCYVRMIATIVAYFNMGILLQGRVDLFRIIAQLVAILLFIESVQTISQFLKGSNENTDLTVLIMSLKGTAGNKNIFAAGLAIKVPFLIYCLHRFKLAGKLLNMVILLFAAWAIFIMNARASYLSLIITLVAYLVFCIITYTKEKKLDLGLLRVGMVIAPIVIAFFISQIELSNTLSSQQEQQSQSFGSVTTRFESIAATNDESNQVRFRLWAHAIDYTKKHPLMGCGVGNWKIASIPYQRTITNDLYVPIHAHNDFLEVFAELGILGGLLYISLFVTLIVFTWKTFFSNASEETKLASIFSFIALLTYMVDAMFNFPIERPVSQLFFAFVAALNIGAYMKGRQEVGEEKPVPAKANNYKAIFAFVSILMLIPSFYVTYQTYRSLILQRSVLGDLNNEPLTLDWKMVTAGFPSIPNLSATAQPIESIKGRYLYEADRFDEALVLFDKGTKANPVIGYSEFLKAGLYFKKALRDPPNEKKWLDSAFRNGMLSFYTRPKAKTYYQTLIAVLAKMRDTANIEKVFLEYDRYRHHAYGWDMFLKGMINAETGLGRMPPRMIRLVDSGLTVFPNDSDLVKRRSEILSNSLVFNRAPGSTLATVSESSKQYMAGVAAFNSGQLEKAGQLFQKALALNPANLAALENAAICYFNLRQYPKAIVLFDRELATKLSGDGKPEYYKAIALINTGRKEEGCSLLQIAANKKFQPTPADPTRTPEALMKSNCGK